MRKRSQVSGCLFLAWMLLTFGCGKSKPADVQKPSDGTAPPKIQAAPETTTAVAETVSPVTSIDEGSALAAVKRTLSSIERGDLAEAYNFLPPTYQSDIDVLVHEFASKMDPEVWSRLFGTLRKSVKVLKEKKSFILELDLFAGRPEYEPMRQHWDDAVMLLDQFASSDAAKLESLKGVKAKSLLPGAASNIVKHLDAIGLGVGADLARQFADIDVKQIKATGDEHVLSFQSPRDEQPIEIVYVKQDGHWLPKPLVEQWGSGIETDRAWLARLPEQIKLAKPRLLEALTMADGLLDNLLAANNREEFQQAAGPAILSLAMSWPRMQQLAQQSAAGRVDPSPITIVIDQELTDSEQQKFISSVLKPLNSAGADYTLLVNDGRTVCRLTQATDVDSIREIIAKHFGVKSDAVVFDTDARQIKIELNR